MDEGEGGDEEKDGKIYWLKGQVKNVRGRDR